MRARPLAKIDLLMLWLSTDSETFVSIAAALVYPYKCDRSQRIDSFCLINRALTGSKFTSVVQLYFVGPEPQSPNSSLESVALSPWLIKQNSSPSLKVMPTKHCVWEVCNSDSRYPERCSGVKFIPFVHVPKSNPWNRDKALRWIKACGRPRHQLNLDIIAKNRYQYILSLIHISEPTRPY